MRCLHLRTFHFILFKGEFDDYGDGYLPIKDSDGWYTLQNVPSECYSGEIVRTADNQIVYVSENAGDGISHDSIILYNVDQDRWISLNIPLDVTIAEHTVSRIGHCVIVNSFDANYVLDLERRKMTQWFPKPYDEIYDRKLWKKRDAGNAVLTPDQRHAILFANNTKDIWIEDRSDDHNNRIRRSKVLTKYPINNAKVVILPCLAEYDLAVTGFIRENYPNLFPDCLSKMIGNYFHMDMLHLFDITSGSHLSIAVKDILK